MEDFVIKLAGRNIAISCWHGETKAFCRDYLVPAPKGDDKPDITVCVNPLHLERERKEAEREYGADAARFSDAYLETLAVYRQIAVQMPQFQTILFHGSVIAVDGEAYLFTAPSGTGKSTHTRLWRECFGPRAFMVNDDKPLIALQEDGQVIAYGTPWDGKHKLSRNTGVPVKGICILSRGEKNEIARITKEEAFGTMYQQTYRPTENPQVIRQTLEILDGLMKVPLWHLACTISKEAVQVAYNAMSLRREQE